MNDDELANLELETKEYFDEQLYHCAIGYKDSGLGDYYNRVLRLIRNYREAVWVLTPDQAKAVELVGIKPGNTK
jgi:hypothetical protein